MVGPAMTHDAAREAVAREWVDMTWHCKQHWTLLPQEVRDGAYIATDRILAKLAEMGYRQLSPEFVKEFDAMAERFPSNGHQNVTDDACYRSGIADMLLKAAQDPPARSFSSLREYLDWHRDELEYELTARGLAVVDRQEMANLASGQNAQAPDGQQENDPEGSATTSADLREQVARLTAERDAALAKLITAEGWTNMAYSERDEMKEENQRLRAKLALITGDEAVEAVAKVYARDSGYEVGQPSCPARARWISFAG